ncbi:hypothetical protein EA58_13705 [Photobacterium galatheae]|uniref:Uncharacterized protein n=1 Tax=Photobacterium galatheae TaxID=1654360 RepID=A0A066RU58_9GAMM|nr:hypothetical protein EA58_13705 [Photobacterium galatheae]
MGAAVAGEAEGDDEFGMIGAAVGEAVDVMGLQVGAFFCFKWGGGVAVFAAVVSNDFVHFPYAETV